MSELLAPQDPADHKWEMLEERRNRASVMRTVIRHLHFVAAGDRNNHIGVFSAGTF